MKKILSLFMVILMLFSVTCITPTVYAEETSYTVIDDDLAKVYWEELYDASYLSSLNIVKSNNWYYAYAKSIYVDEVIIYVCGYDGKETEITIPTEFDGKQIKCVEEFYIMSNTVKTIKIPKEITSINGIDDNVVLGDDEERYYESENYPPVIECPNSPLEEIIVDSENPDYTSQDGVLFTKSMKRLIYYPKYKQAEKYVVPAAVEYIVQGAFAEAKNLKSLTITPNVDTLGFGCIPKKGLEELRFENVSLPQVGYWFREGEEPVTYPKYVPDVPNTVVYCVEGSKLYEIYEQSFEEPESECKELIALPEFTGTLVKESDGKWYYYENEYKVLKSTLVKYKDVWFYVKNGIWDKSVTNRIISYKGKKFYIKNGKWNSNINTLVKIDGEWLGIVNGKWDTSIKTLIKYKGKWFYINNGKWDSSAKTLTKYKGKWFYIKNGKWCKDTAIVKYKGKRFYVKNGKVDFDYSGNKKIDGKTYKIKNGKVA